MDTLFQYFLTYPIHTFGKGQVILRPEQEQQQIFFILSGFVRAFSINEEGNEFSTILLGSHMYFPTFRYLSDGSYTKRVVTKYYHSSMTKVDVVTINNSDLALLLKTNPMIAHELTHMYYQNTKSLLSKLEFMVYTHNAYKKVCYFLLSLCKKFGRRTEDSVEILPPFTHKELATFVGLSRESVSHQLSILQKKEIIQRFHPIIHISNIHLLENELRE